MTDRGLFAAYLDCPYKAFLMAQGKRQGDGSALEFSFMEEALLRQGETLRKLRQSSDVFEEGDMFYEAASKGASKHGSGRIGCVPIRILPDKTPSRNQRLLLGFDALVLRDKGLAIGRYGKFIHATTLKTSRTDVQKQIQEADKILKQMRRFIESGNDHSLTLNRHCKLCRFTGHCHGKARDKDDLSLMESLPKKEIIKLNKRGIFTVTQLSHSFRPVRKRTDVKPRHLHALKALALREKKIHVDEMPEPRRMQARVFLDVEGMPGRRSYYLIGLIIEDGKTTETHSFWADGPQDEGRIWKEFLSVMRGLHDFSLFHFGSYEVKFIKDMAKRHSGCDEAELDRWLASMVNVLTHCHLNVYFPTYSNSLKDIAGYLGYVWDEPEASGLRSILWRLQWERTGEAAVKEKLARYNLQDCEALKLVSDAIFEIIESGKIGKSQVERAENVEQGNPYRFGNHAFSISEFEYVTKCAYFDYQRARIYWRGDKSVNQRRRRLKELKAEPTVDAIVVHERPKRCPFCKGSGFTVHDKASRTIVDLRFSNAGIQKWVTDNRAQRFKCHSCLKTFYPESYSGLEQKFGKGLIAWSVYQNIALRQSYGNILMSLNDTFGFSFKKDNLVYRWKEQAVLQHQKAYDGIKRKVQSGHLVHVDETRVSVRGVTGYVWAFTNLEEVIYVYNKSRDRSALSEILDGFKGVLVSDFFSAYDSFPTPQQRCLIHLVRDLNEDLLKNQFDIEFKGFVLEFGKLLKEIVLTIDKHGLCRRYLKKYKPRVGRFFKECVEAQGVSELLRKYQIRFRKNEDRLFTFLDHDNVPWNNNNAENAIKGFVSLRKVIGGTSTEEGLKNSLMLLSISQTLRNREQNFLRFLLS